MCDDGLFVHGRFGFVLFFRRVVSFGLDDRLSFELALCLPFRSVRWWLLLSIKSHGSYKHNCACDRR